MVTRLLLIYFKIGDCYCNRQFSDLTEKLKIQDQRIRALENLSAKLRRNVGELTKSLEEMKKDMNELLLMIEKPKNDCESNTDISVDSRSTHCSIAESSCNDLDSERSVEDIFETASKKHKKKSKEASNLIASGTIEKYVPLFCKKANYGNIEQRKKESPYSKIPVPILKNKKPSDTSGSNTDISMDSRSTHCSIAESSCDDLNSEISIDIFEAASKKHNKKKSKEASNVLASEAFEKYVPLVSNETNHGSIGQCKEEPYSKIPVVITKRRKDPKSTFMDCPDCMLFIKAHGFDFSKEKIEECGYHTNEVTPPEWFLQFNWHSFWEDWRRIK